MMRAVEDASPYGMRGGYKRVVEDASPYEEAREFIERNILHGAVNNDII